VISGLRVGAFCMGTSIVFPATVSALTQEEIKWCVNKDYAYSLDLRIEGCTAAIKSDPKYAAAYSDRCNAYQLKGDYDRAIADCDQALSLDPKDTAAYYNRGDAYKLKRDWPQRPAELERAKSYEEKAKSFVPTSFDFEALAKRIAQSAVRRAPAQSDGRK
jgi:tetratricopeptide (TPR) repeat protein